MLHCTEAQHLYFTMNKVCLIFKFRFNFIKDVLIELAISPNDKHKQHCNYIIIVYVYILYIYLSEKQNSFSNEEYTSFTLCYTFTPKSQV